MTNNQKSNPQLLRKPHNCQTTEPKTLKLFLQYYIIILQKNAKKAL